MDKIAKRADLSQKDCMVDLGAGRGRSLLFWHNFYHCRGKGYEWVPLFCNRANRLFQAHQLPLFMKNQSMIEGLEEEVTVAYLYGPNFSTSFLKALVEKLLCYPQLKRVISISFPISDYSVKGGFSSATEFSVFFPWGRTKAYIQERIS